MFQAAWLIFILGGSTFSLISLALIFIAHRFMFSPSAAEWTLIYSVAGLGVVVDSLLVHFQLLPLTPSYFLAVPLAPWWLISLWAVFAMTLHHSLSFLQGKVLISIFLSAIAAPWAYYAGAYLHGVTLTWQGLLAIAVIWAIWLPATICYIAAKNADRNYSDETSNKG